MIGADVLVLLTDTAGLFTANPRTHADATLIPYVDVVTPELEAMAGGAGSPHGSGVARSRPLPRPRMTWEEPHARP